MVVSERTLHVEQEDKRQRIWICNPDKGPSLYRVLLHAISFIRSSRVESLDLTIFTVGINTRANRYQRLYACNGNLPAIKEHNLAMPSFVRCRSRDTDQDVICDRSRISVPDR